MNHRLYAAALQNPLAALHQDWPYEVVLSSWAYPDSCAAELLSRAVGVPFVMIVQGSDVHQYLDNAIRRRLICRAACRSSGVIARSADLARRLHLHRVPESRTRVIYNGVDTTRFSYRDRREARLSLGLEHDRPTVLFVGNLTAVKRPDLVLEAVARLSRSTHPRCRLIVIGTGPLIERLRSQAARLQLERQLLLIGRRRPDEVARFMQAADVLCVPSDNEGSPNVILEALASGLPVVATRVGGIPEIIPDEGLGILVPPGDPEALALAFAKTLAARPNRDRLVAYARRFSWRATADAYYEVLRTAVDRPEHDRYRDAS